MNTPDTEKCCGEWTGKDAYDCDKDGARTKPFTCKCPCHTPDTEWEKEFIEKGADLEHTRWAKWQKHFFSKCVITEASNEVMLLITKNDYERWVRQIETPYADLSEHEKESDRIEVRSYLPLINQVATSRDTYWKERVRKEVEGIKEQILCQGCDNELEYCDCTRNEILDTLLDNLK